MARVVAVSVVATTASAQICSDKACFGDDNNCRNYQQIVELCGPNAVCRPNSAKGVDTCYPAYEEQQEALEVCSDKACFGDDNNCRNYQQIVDLCGPNAVCRPNSAKGVDTCYPAYEEQQEALEICSDKACFGDDNNCRNYQQIVDLCGANAVCRPNSAKGVDTCYPAYEEQQEVLEVCSDKACFGDDNNCRNYQQIVDLCGANAVCRPNSAKGVDTCYPAYEEQQEALEVCSDKACFGDDNNCRNYQQIVDLCGPSAVCRPNSAKGVDTCYPAYEEQQEALEVCSDKACFGDDNNCRNYQQIVDLCGPNAVCLPNSAKGVDTCYPAYEEQQKEFEVCSDKACFGDDNNCRNYQQIVDLCGPDAVCRPNSAKGVDTCYPAFEISDVSV